MSDPKPNLYGMERKELESALEPLEVPRYHAGQIFSWMYRRRVLDPEGWTDLPRSLRNHLASSFRTDTGTVSGTAGADDGTIKYRIDLPGGGQVEAVSMIQDDRVTLCLSSQVGCALGCSFCLTAKMGLKRNLTAGEILGQVHLMIQDRGIVDTPCNIVYMGMGEPLHNYEGVTASTRLLTDPSGAGWSRKRITLSTAGLVPAIVRLAGEPVRPRLAVSLNATTDAVRDRLMPVNRKYPLEALLDACRRFSLQSRDPLTFEYVLLAGVNDSDSDIRRLAKIVRDHRAKLNLIPFNAVPGWLEYESPDDDRVRNIRDRLLDLGIPVSVRWSRGRNARAACGQLAML
jgi:23S rRNA (adenine2503-C2)-methyltransferase